MKGNQVKLGVLIAFMLIGILTLATAFDSESSSVTPSSDAASVSPTASPSKAPKKKTDGETSVGAQVGVYNGTASTGLAAEVGNKLERAGYVIVEVGNTVGNQKSTIVYYSKPNFEPAATLMADQQFNGAPVEPKPTDLKILNSSGNESSPSKSAQVLALVGDDYSG